MPWGFPGSILGLEGLVGLCCSLVAACAVDAGYCSLPDDPHLPVTGDGHVEIQEGVASWPGRSRNPLLRCPHR